MLLGDILLARDLIKPEDIDKAVAHQKENGGRFGDALVAVGALADEDLQAILSEAPGSPKRIEETGIAYGSLLNLMIKTIIVQNLETPSQMANAIKLPFNSVKTLVEDCIERKLMSALGSAEGGSISDMRYAMTEAGKRWANDALEQNQYVGPAPVSLQAFHDRVLMQRITNERIDRETIGESFADLTVPEEFVMRLGPAINSGRCILLYGPAGNGKTTIAEKIGAIFENVVYIPYCFEVEGQIVKVFDPAVHKEVPKASDSSAQPVRIRREEFDQRWVACYRPTVIAGGELTLDMLDLGFNPIAKFYEAPLHVKALSGTFIIDDFGRQRVSPEDLLNRWIVPLASRVDYLKLHTGASFQVPFDELVIFSTNLEPNDLMDPAFLRRIPYKLQTEEPSVEDYSEVFKAISESQGLDLPQDILSFIVKELKENLGVALAYFQPGFIVEQVLSACKYRGIAPTFDKALTEDALRNLHIKRADEG